MPQFYGTNLVRKQERRLKTAFELVAQAQVDKELESHYARYLCIRVAGFAEQSVRDLVSAHARHYASKPIHSYVESRISKLWGIDKSKLEEVVSALDPSWWDGLTSNMSQELESLNSVGKTRNNVSHGGDQGITLDTVIQYRDDVIRLIRRLCEIFDPQPPESRPQ